jgi:hypothetical protein
LRQFVKLWRPIRKVKLDAALYEEKFDNLLSLLLADNLTNFRSFPLLGRTRRFCREHAPQEFKYLKSDKINNS